MIQLRDYQIKAVTAIYDFFRFNSGNPIVALPTGTGKSLIIAAFIKSTIMRWRDQRIMVLTHVKELIEQDYNKLLEFWPTAPAGIYSAALKRRDTRANIIFAGIDSVRDKADLFSPINLIIIDECHLVDTKDKTRYAKFIKDVKKQNKNIKVIGFSATPYRLGLGLLQEGGLFTDTCIDMTTMQDFKYFIENKYLANLIPRRQKTTFDLTDVKIIGGDYSLSSLEKSINKAVITRQAVDEILEYAADRKKWLIFASGLDHSKNIADILKEKNISCAVISSKLSQQERSQILLDYSRGLYKAVINNNILTTGFDAPDIDCIIVLRPTQSPALWVQMLGRGTRPYKNKENCLVLDFARNTERLGPINDPAIPKKKKNNRGLVILPPPMKICPKCDTYANIRAVFCEGCEHIFDINTKLVNTASTKELINTEDPIYINARVASVTYRIKSKKNKPDNLEVTYYCKTLEKNPIAQSYKVYICFEHGGYATVCARRWWANASQNILNYPSSTQEAYDRTETLQLPKILTIHINKLYPEIIKYEY